MRGSLRRREHAIADQASPHAMHDHKDLAHGLDLRVWLIEQSSLSRLAEVPTSYLIT